MTLVGGARSTNLIAFHAEGYAADIGQHVMPMQKFARVRDGIVASDLPYAIQAPEPVTDEDLLRVHTPAYVRAISTGEPRALAESQKFPWSPELAAAVRLTNGGCVAALEAALDRGVAANLASGFHHAHADHGEGFCTFNGLAVALERARARGRVRRALVVDLDLHYGNGTASIFGATEGLHNLSIYGSWYKQNRASDDVTTERAADTETCRSVPLPNGTGGDAYLEIIAREVPLAIERARPDVVFYQAGADPYREDPYSRLDLDHDDLFARDRLVFTMLRERSLPVAWVLAGGYTKDIAKVVAVHVGTARAAAEVFA